MQIRPNAAENVDKTADFWLRFSDRVWKIERLSPKITLNTVECLVAELERMNEIDFSRFATNFKF